MALAYQLFEGKCIGCGKSIPTFAKDRKGTPARVSCGRVCDTYEAVGKTYLKEKLDKKNMITLNKSISTEELTKRMSTKDWNNKEYLTEEIQV